MHPLHDYLAKQVSERLKAKPVLVWYDTRQEFGPFIEEIRGGPAASGDLSKVDLGGTGVRLAEYSGSYFELRAVVEPYVAADDPEPLIIYLSGVEHDRRGSVLMELEKAGERYERSLKQLARNVLKQRYTDGVIDEMLAPERVSYDDLVRAMSDSASAEPPSLLKAIFHDAANTKATRNEAILASWLVADTHDAEIVAKEATRELLKLIKSKLGLELPLDAPLGKVRAVTLRYVLGSEFRLDLTCAPPSCLDGIPGLKTKEDETAVRSLAQDLRTGYPNEYEIIADRVETELGLKNADVPAASLGSIDTFRFGEVSLLQHCGELIASHQFEQAIAIVTKREQSFWLQRDVVRKALWEASRRMAELGMAASAIGVDIKKVGTDPNAWIKAYTQSDGWYRLDQAQRRLESWVANLDDPPDERPLGIVRRVYEDACQTMADGFTRALLQSNWTISSALHQTRIFSTIVSERPKPVAYFLVDAMRYEMGVELAGRLPKTAEVSVRPAIAVLPSITPLGMAALLPGASSSFSVVEQNDRLGARIDDSFLPDLPARKKFAAARIPNLVDLALDELLGLPPTKLKKKIDGGQMIVVRSQEIDHAGEAGFPYQAQQVMDTVIDNLGRAVRKLAAAGVEHFVLTADHGHLFFHEDRDESMRTDSPGGKQIELHRRCWIGRGGTTPPGCIRVTAAALGYASDLEFVFHAGSGVFKAHSDLAFHHGGPSLQELIIPVVTVRLKGREPGKSKPEYMRADGLPAAVTNRIFSVTLQLGGNLALFKREMLVRPFLVSAGKQVGAAGMASDAEFDRLSGCVKLEAGKAATVAFLLTDDSAPSVQVVVQDPVNDAELYRSPEIPVRLGV
jgi:hypothetical protein